MIVYVEHDAEGNLVHVAEVHTTEGRDVGQQLPGLTAEEKAAHAKAVAAAIDAREADTRAALAQATTPHAGLVVLPKGAAVPTAEGHRVDLTTGKVRARTAAERKAYADAQAPGRAGGPP